MSQVLLGMGGQGKTQLALEYCETIRNSGQFQTVFWIDASSIHATVQSFEKIAQRISKSIQVFTDPESRLAYTKQTLERRQRPWLLVFDNYDSPKDFPNIYEYFPRSSTGAILVTSRHADSTRLGDVVKIGGMTEEEGVELLLSQCQYKDTSENKFEGRKIVRALGYLPLAIDQAGAYVRARKLDLKLFTQHYAVRKEFILACTPQLWEYRKRFGENEGDVSLSAFTTWELSFQQISGDDKEQEALGHFLTLSAFLNPAKISEDLFKCHFTSASQPPQWMDDFGTERRWDHYRFQDIIVRLSNLSLVQDIGNTQCHLSLHPLIADWLKLRINLSDRQHYTVEVMTMLTTYIESQGRSTKFADKEDTISHLDACLENGREFLTEENWKSKLLPHLATYASFYQSRDRFRDAEELLQKVLTGKENSLGHEHLSTLQAVNDFGILYHKLGRSREAVDMLQRAHVGREKVLGPKNIATLESLHNLGVVYRDQGKFDEAAVMLDQAWKGREKILVSNHSSTLDSANCLGVVYYDQKMFGEAEAMYQRALGGQKEILGADFETTLHVVNNLAVLFTCQGKLEEAESFYKQALTGYQAFAGPEHTLTLRTVNNLGVFYSSHGKSDEAEEMYRRALEGFEAVLGPEHASTLQTMKNLAFLYQNRSKLELAELLYRRILNVEEASLGPNHASTLETVHCLGLLYIDQGKDIEGKSMCLRALGGKDVAAVTLELQNARELWRAWDEAKQYPRRFMSNQCVQSLPRLYSNRRLIPTTSIYNAIIFSGFGESNLPLAALATPQSISTRSDDWTQLLLEKIFVKGEEHIYNMALKEGNEALRRLLVENSSRTFSTRTGPRNSILLWAVYRGDEPAVRLLLKDIARRDPCQSIESTSLICDALQDAACRSKVSILRILLHTGVEIEARSMELLRAAAVGGNEESLLLLLSRGVDVHAGDEDPRTPLDTDDQWIYNPHIPLHIAAEKGHMAITQLLISRGADPNLRDRGSITALHFAARHGSVEVVQVLLDTGADINAKSTDGETPLHQAVFGEDDFLTRRWLKSGKPGHITTPFQRLNVAPPSTIARSSASHEAAPPGAAPHGHEAIVKLLLQNGANVSAASKAGFTALHVAVLNGHEAIIKLLLEKGASASAATSTGWTPLHVAVLNNHEGLVRLLVDHKADVEAKDECGQTPLLWAAMEGHEAVVRLLLECEGVELDSKNRSGRTPLSWAAVNGHEAVVRLLLEHGDVELNSKEDAWGRTPLSLAAVNGREAVVRLLIERESVELDSNDTNGHTPLLLAAVNGHDIVVQLLLEKGVNVNRQYDFYGNALQAAAYHGRQMVVQLLMVYGADCDQLDEHGRNALHVAARGGNLNVVNYLLDQGLDFSARDKRGDTIIDYAASGGNLPVIERVLQLIRPEWENTDGWSPLHWASRVGDSHIIRHLVDAGVKEYAVKTGEPSWSWTPHAIAVFHQNWKLAPRPTDETTIGNEYIESLNEEFNSNTPLASSTDQTSHAIGTKSRYWCDGCFHDIYGTRYHCTSCSVFDYCFMCKMTADKTHPNHSWEVIETNVEQ